MQKVGPYKKVPSSPLKGKPVCLIMVPGGESNPHGPKPAGL